MQSSYKMTAMDLIVALDDWHGPEATQVERGETLRAAAILILTEASVLGNQLLQAAERMERTGSVLW